MEKQIEARVSNWSFSRLIQDVSIPEKHRASLLTKQLETVSSMIFVMLFANILNVAVVIQSFNDSNVGSPLAIWGFCFVFITGLAVLRHMRARLASREGRLSGRHLEAISRGALIIGLFWAVVPLIVNHAVDPRGQMVIGIIMAGLMFGGTFLLSRLPAAAYSFMIPIGAGLIVSMQLQET